MVPRLVRLDSVTPLANVVPVKVPAAAGTVMASVPSKLTPLMARAVARAVAVAALPAVFWFSIGKSAAIAIEGTPVPVVFLRIPVPSVDRSVPLIPTTVRPVAPVASPV
jgi:hypothetical protein